MTDDIKLPTYPHSPGRVTVKLTDLEAYEARWQQVRANQVESMNNLLRIKNELEDRQGADAQTIAELTAEVGELSERIRQLEVMLETAAAERAEAVRQVAMVKSALNVTIDVSPTSLTTGGYVASQTLSGPADVTWERRHENPEPVDEATAELEDEEPTGRHAAVRVELPDNEERPSTTLGA